ncbi:MAG: SH3 domain-containing protein [Pseudomonadota bacterium]
MNKFIFVSFAFLALAFYELSGGADFVAPERPVQTVKLQTDPAMTEREGSSAPTAETASVTPKIRTTSPDQTDLATTPRIETRADIPSPDRAAQASVEAAQLDTPVLPSLIPRPDDFEPPTVNNVPVAVVDEIDRRVVSGQRINVREGPGTSYAVISGLARGDTVEVIEDSGGGWVKLRLQDGVSEGWVAAFLLSEE